jgi:hypothetical protein
MVTEATFRIAIPVSSCKFVLVKITPLFKYHKNIFILDGILICHKSYDTLTPLLISVTYIDLTENVPDECNAQTNTSLSPYKFTSCKDAIILCQSLRFLPLNSGERKYSAGLTYARETRGFDSVKDNVKGTGGEFAYTVKNHQNLSKAQNLPLHLSQSRGGQEKCGRGAHPHCFRERGFASTPTDLMNQHGGP